MDKSLKIEHLFDLPFKPSNMAFIGHIFCDSQYACMSVNSTAYNKQSCRECGTFLTPRSVCVTCNEYNTWTCAKCGKMEDVTHKHHRYPVVVQNMIT